MFVRTNLTDYGRLGLMLEAVDQVIRASVVILSLGFFTLEDE